MVFGYKVDEVRKFLVAVAGLVSLFVAQGFLSKEVENWISGVIAVLTAALVFVVQNADQEKVALRQELREANKENPGRYDTGHVNVSDPDDEPGYL